MGEAKRRSGGSRRAQLQGLFVGLGIDYRNPGFYDDPIFIAEEKCDPRMLESYAEWVTHRERTAEYDAHVRATLEKLAPIISARLDRHNWLGACFAASGMLTRMLDRLGVWNAIMTGSVSIYTETEGRHFAIVDEHEGAGYQTGHQWLIAPPYDIVDLTLFHQRWLPEDMDLRSLAPKIVLKEQAEIVRPRAQDVIAPALLRNGTDAEMYGRLRDQRRFGSIFPARKILLGPLDIRYVASGVTAPNEPLEDINTAGGPGVPAIEIWREDVLPAFGGA